jgi:SAM-dependent methyltransferase
MTLEKAMTLNTLRIRLLKAMVHTVGRLSGGIRIALEEGFTSGKMVDYAYRNKPSGRWPIGRLLDRIYLSNKGWEAVRTRKRHLEELLERAIRSRLESAGGALVLDVASGQAKYLQDTLLKFTGRDVQAVCWDLEDRWLEEGQASAGDRGLRMTYERGDALDSLCFARLPRRPDIVIASGLYEWLEDDQLVKRSLAHIAGAVNAGGYLLLTMLAGHVDLEMANEVFPGFGGRKLSMKIRSADQVLRWVRQAGFDSLQTRLDEWGYHMVCLARKCAGGTRNAGSAEEAVS